MAKIGKNSCGNPHDPCGFMVKYVPVAAPEFLRCGNPHGGYGKAARIVRVAARIFLPIFPFMAENLIFGHAV